ncbi:hypothetical protein PR048_017879 [Dryococelus australis]|uniref:Uncharacterized protein n=1 Tax=Dryococelus australis TaxID=614101 RepID=A0ABQ9HAP1_9NEOP|nr:hypothetical protein PR048_017879 [Dryococelus australis]
MVDAAVQAWPAQSDPNDPQWLYNELIKGAMLTKLEDPTTLTSALALVISNMEGGVLFPRMETVDSLVVPQAGLPTKPADLVTLIKECFWCRGERFVESDALQDAIRTYGRRTFDYSKPFNGYTVSFSSEGILPPVWSRHTDVTSPSLGRDLSGWRKDLGGIIGEIRNLSIWMEQMQGTGKLNSFPLILHPPGQYDLLIGIGHLEGRFGEASAGSTGNFACVDSLTPSAASWTGGTYAIASASIFQKKLNLLRLQWARERRCWRAEWQNVVLKYESRFNLFYCDGRIHVRRYCGNCNLAACIVERYSGQTPSVMVWGAIGYNMQSRPLRIEGNLNSNRYIREVLEPEANPHAIFQQDSARPHVASNVQAPFNERRVLLLPWPARSPNMLPIEHDWDMVGQWLVRHGPPAVAVDALWLRIHTAWREIPQEHIQVLFDTMPLRVAVTKRLARSPPTKSNRVTGFSHVGIVPDDAVGRQVFSRISRFTRPFSPALLHTHLNHFHRLSRPRCLESSKSLRSLHLLFLRSKKVTYASHVAENMRNACRPRSVRTVRLEEVIRQHIDDMPSTSTRSIARQIGVSHSTVCDVLWVNRCHPYRWQKVQVARHVTNWGRYIKNLGSEFTVRIKGPAYLELSSTFEDEKSGTIDSELQWQTVSPDLVIIGFSGLPPAMVANLKTDSLQKKLTNVDWPKSSRGRGGLVARVLVSRLGEPCSIPGGTAPGPSQSAGFLGDSPLSSPLNYGASPCSSRFTLIGSQDPDFKVPKSLHSISGMWESECMLRIDDSRRYRTTSTARRHLTCAIAFSLPLAPRDWLEAPRSQRDK